MVPRIAKRGHSFKGAGAYYLHDKNAQTDERVSWVTSVNLLSQNPQNALKEMAWTDLHAEQLRALNGGSRAGRKSSTGNVYAYSLAWSPDQKPTSEQMEDAAHETLNELGLKDHQALLIAHNDTDHDHVHVLVNLVNGDTGLVANVHQDAYRLSEWAMDYERRCGAIQCPQRVENNALREQGVLIKHKEKEAKKGPSIAELYHASSNGHQFKDALDEIGYALAKGDRRGFVVVDAEGEVHSLSRQLKGVRPKKIKEKFFDVDESALPTAKDVQKTLEQTREQQEITQDNVKQEEVKKPGLSFADIERVFHSESQEKREAFLDELSREFETKEQGIKEEREIHKATLSATGFSGLWNAVTGRSQRARDHLAALRSLQRRLREKRLRSVFRFEAKQEKREEQLKKSEKARFDYMDRLKVSSVSKGSKLVHELE